MVYLYNAILFGRNEVITGVVPYSSSFSKVPFYPVETGKLKKIFPRLPCI